MDDRKCIECNTELYMTFYGRYTCPICGTTCYESDFVENERGTIWENVSYGLNTK